MKQIFPCATYIWDYDRDSPVVGTYLVEADDHLAAKNKLMDMIKENYPSGRWDHHDVVVGSPSRIIKA